MIKYLLNHVDEMIIAGALAFIFIKVREVIGIGTLKWRPFFGLEFAFAALNFVIC